VKKSHSGKHICARQGGGDKNLIHVLIQRKSISGPVYRRIVTGRKFFELLLSYAKNMGTKMRASFRENFSTLIIFAIEFIHLFLDSIFALATTRRLENYATNSSSERRAARAHCVSTLVLTHERLRA
jgi:hypothetical protein